MAPPLINAEAAPPALQSLPERCINGVRLACWNITRLTDRYKDILALRSTHGVDLVCVQELGVLDSVLFRSLRRIRGFHSARLWYCARPGGKGGGVAIIALNPALRIQVVSRFSRGGLTVRVWLPGFAPFAVTDCYFPPAGSPYDGDVDLICAWLLHEVTRLCGTLGLRGHVIAADWNSHQGCKGRVTPDQKSCSGRITALQRALKASPALGRSDGALSATYTSRGLQSDRRNPTALSEVDGFWCDSALPLSRLGGLDPGDRPAWSDYFCFDGDPGGPRLPGDLTHLPVILDFQPEIAALNAPPQKRSKPPARDSYTPVYVERSWAQRARANLEHLSRVGELAADPESTLDAVYTAIRDGTLAAAKEVHPHSAHASTAVYRLFHNSAMPTPAAFVNDLVEARKLAADGKRLRQRGRFALDIDDDERKRLEATGKELQLQSKHIRTRANTIERGVIRRWRAQLSHAFDRARRIDPHSLAQMVVAELTLADPLFSEPDHCIPEAPGKPAPLEYFTDFISELNSEWRLERAPGASKHRQFWKRVTPVAPDDPSVTLPVSATLLYCLVFPLTKRSRPARCCDGPCVVCDRLQSAWTAWQPHEPLNTAPQPLFKPSLRASRATGPDGLRCEDWRWARPEDLDERFEYRMTLSTHLAAFVNRILAEGRVPDEGFADCISTPVFKPGKPGQPKPDPAEPNNYRDITVGQLLAKLVSLVLTFRLSHWAVRHSMISPEQVAFLPYHSAESHVFAFTQLLRSRARASLSTRGLFVDLEKAYNRVHLGSLWCLLRDMNVPARIVEILDDWATKRRTRLRVNGELSRAYSMLAGTPQGDPLSCLLFNLFIEPLIRYINSIDSIRGVPIPGSDRRLKSKFFADDMLGLSALEPDDSPLIMRAVMRWCNDWYAKPGLSAGKTETNSYLCDADAAGDNPPPIVYAHPVDDAAEDNCAAAPAAGEEAPVVWGPWKVEIAAAAEAASKQRPAPPIEALVEPRAITESDSYRYLGLRLSTDLTDRLATDHIIRTIDGLYHRHFTFNLTIRRCSPTLQLQLINSNVFGPVTYLLSILSVSSDIRSKFDSRARRFGRHVFGLPRGAPNSVVTALTRFNSFDALQARERARLFLQLSDPLLPTSIAHAVLTGVLNEARGQRLAHANMPARHIADVARLELLGIAPPPRNPPHYLVAIEAGLYGDRIARQQWQHEARVASAVPDPPRGDRPRRSSQVVQPPDDSLRLPRPLPTDHAADIYFNFNLPANVVPLRHGLVPLSYLGPGGTSIPALSNRQHQIAAIVARLHTGNIALRRHPWRPRNPVRPAVRAGTGNIGADDELSDDDTVSSGSSGSSEDESGGDNENDLDNIDTDSPCPSSASDMSPVPPGRNQASPAAAVGPAAASPRAKRVVRKFAPGPDHPRAAALPCRLCGQGHEHPAHIFLECAAGRLPALRETLLIDALDRWTRLLARVEDAVLSEHRETVPDAPAARAALTAAFNADDKTEARWLVHRLLWAIPWPADAVPENATAARILGVIFDQTILSRHASRPLADTWVSWAARWTTTFGAHWAELLRTAAPSDAAGAPPAASQPQSPLAIDSDPASPQPSSPLTDPFLPSSQSSPPGFDPDQ